MNIYPWLVRREFWENRAIWIVPAAIGAALTLAALFGRVDFDGLSTAHQSRELGGAVLFGFGFAFFAVMNLYSAWYLLDCLYADRKDRSILFWKSLPISDTATVLSKLFTGLIAIPLVYFLAADVSTLLMAFVVSVRARSTVGSALWQPDVWLQLQVLWLYLIATTAIWYLPFSGWLLLVSAWARRAVMLWSILPPLAAYLLERWFFGTHLLGAALQERAFGYIPRAFNGSARAFAVSANPSGWAASAPDRDPAMAPVSVWHMLDPLGFLAAPATWGGLLVGIAFIAGAIQLRLRRTEN